MAKHHIITWFYNRIGKKVYCTDHLNKNKDWTECKGIIIDCKNTAENLKEKQKDGITFSD